MQRSELSGVVLQLKALGVRTWFDGDKMTGSINRTMSAGIADSAAMAFLHEDNVHMNLGRALGTAPTTATTTSASWPLLESPRRGDLAAGSKEGGRQADPPGCPGTPTRTAPA